MNDKNVLNISSRKYTRKNIQQKLNHQLSTEAASTKFIQITVNMGVFLYPQNKESVSVGSSKFLAYEYKMVNTRSVTLTNEDIIQHKTSNTEKHQKLNLNIICKAKHYPRRVKHSTISTTNTVISTNRKGMYGYFFHILTVMNLAKPDLHNVSSVKRRRRKNVSSKSVLGSISIWNWLLHEIN